MVDFNDVSELRDIAEGEPVVVVTLEQLRDALGYRRIGTLVLAEMKQKLAGSGLGYFPRDILDNNSSPSQYEEIRVYLKDSNVGKIVESVFEPTVAGDTFLAGFNDNSDTSTLEEIRRLLGD